MPDVYVIAEAGVNHNGELELARRLVDRAADAGADAVKFQTFDAKKLGDNVNAPKATYQQQSTDVPPNRSSKCCVGLSCHTNGTGSCRNELAQEELSSSQPHLMRIAYPSSKNSICLFTRCLQVS